ncbi:MAG: bifunctional phosphopantothenoylcysteine decarboxylase/phosphopantothenate--cysteine ligase CoaBC [Candidatus Asgardarchaeia archaeon]
MFPHPSKNLIGSKTNYLAGKRIILGICGSVAAIKSPEIARELMRNGADVWTVMTRESQKIIHPYLMEWATGNPVVTDLTGKIEHVSLIGEDKHFSDLLLVAPATANTISKIACGIDDTPVTSVATVALGSGVPIIIVSAMHDAMYKNPHVKENIKKLKSKGVTFVDPVIEEGKAKIAPIEHILFAVLKKIAFPSDLEGLRILVTAGPTREYIDPIRFISNPSSGRMGIALANAAYLRGADVTLVYGPGIEKPPEVYSVINVTTSKEMLEQVLKLLNQEKYDIFISAAAISDFTPVVTQNEKISSEKPYTIQLVPTPKIIAEVKKKYPSMFVVGFKAEYNVSDEELVNRAYKTLEKDNIDLIVANDVSRVGVGFESITNEVLIISKERRVTKVSKKNKFDVANEILFEILKELKYT